MAKQKRIKHKASSGAYIPLPRKFLTSDSVATLTPKALKLFIDLLSQYNGFNNGNLTCSRTVLLKRGWTSHRGIDEAKLELLDKRFIMLTRQGGKHKCSLYALTLYAVDECIGKNLEVKPTDTPIGGWSNGS